MNCITTSLDLKDDIEYVYVNDITNTDLRKTSSMAEESYDYPVVENKIYEGFSCLTGLKSGKMLKRFILNRQRCVLS